MNTFSETKKGWLYAVASERAVEYSGGNPQKLAEVCFAFALSERGIDLDWNPRDGIGMDERPTFLVPPWEIDLSIITKDGERFKQQEWPTTAAVRIDFYESSLPVVTIFGINSVDEEFEYTNLLPMRDFLKGFPT